MLNSRLPIAIYSICLYTKIPIMQLYSLGSWEMGNIIVFNRSKPNFDLGMNL